MLRELFRSRRFVLGLSLLLIAFVAVFLRDGARNFSNPAREQAGNRVECAASSAVTSRDAAKDRLESEINGKIDLIISLIDDIAD